MITTVIISIVITFLIANITKMMNDYEKTKKIKLSMFFQNGGMPSSHTAIIISTTTAIFLETGLTELFIACVVISFIVMNDAVKVRFETGEEAEVLNKLIKKEHIIHKLLTERVGHTPKEVLAGLIIGIIIPIIIYALYAVSDN
ncbi:MAG: divergent PAP2 family protein [Nanoarchaeota archaeon]|nr:divergent PAP2 family protein [Nanoarchaeota archaeon]MBU1030820.1 divergent PAP2 family protein [Nanoarchaeota archaeon]MBU1850380.1 divergent PAP2 family protein [Nanoarchaeota archaeon]